MAKIESIERRLLNWARWRAGLARGGLGYAKSSYEERVGGEGYDSQAVVPTIDCDASETEDAVASLMPDLKKAVEVVYLDARGMAWYTKRLGLTESGVRARIWDAHHKLARWFADKADGRRVERSRVEALQRVGKK